MTQAASSAAVPAAPARSVRQTAALPGRPAALLLLGLSPLLAELLSGSTPPAEFFNPLGLVLLLLAYGGLAVLLREWAVARRIEGWGRVLLGLALGIFIEGVVCKTLFSPVWADFDFPLGYGRWIGVNWTWSVGVLTYHAVQSLLIPWLIVDLSLPRLRDARALSLRGAAWLGLGVIAAGLFGFLLMPMGAQAGKTVFHPNWIETVFAWGSVPALAWLAAWLGNRRRARLLAAGVASNAPQATRLSPRLLGWLCAVAAPLYILVLPGVLIKTLHAHAAVLLATQLAGLALIGLIAQRLAGRLSTAHRIAMVIGIEGFFILLAPLQELDNAKRPDNTAGMALVGLAALVLLLLWRRRIEAHAAPEPEMRTGTLFQEPIESFPSQ